jgi:hypothetical protein
MLADSLQHVTQHINQQAIGWGFSRWSAPSPLSGGFGARNIRYCRPSCSKTDALPSPR